MIWRIIGNYGDRESVIHLCPNYCCDYMKAESTTALLFIQNNSYFKGHAYLYGLVSVFFCLLHGEFGSKGDVLWLADLLQLAVVTLWIEFLPFLAISSSQNVKMFPPFSLALPNQGPVSRKSRLFFGTGKLFLLVLFAFKIKMIQWNYQLTKQNCMTWFVS